MTAQECVAATHSTKIDIKSDIEDWKAVFDKHRDTHDHKLSTERLNLVLKQINGGRLVNTNPILQQLRIGGNCVNFTEFFTILGKYGTLQKPSPQDFERDFGKPTVSLSQFKDTLAKLNGMTEEETSRMAAKAFSGRETISYQDFLTAFYRTKNLHKK